MSDVIVDPAKTQSKNAIAHVEANAGAKLHPAWRALIRFCREMGYGEIANLKIHDGLPISAEIVTKKIRWY